MNPQEKRIHDLEQALIKLLRVAPAGADDMRLIYIGMSRKELSPKLLQDAEDYGKAVAEARALLEKSTAPGDHAEVFAKMDTICMPVELKPYVEYGVLEWYHQNDQGTLDFDLPKHADECEIITLTWFHPAARPDDGTLFCVTKQLFRDSNCDSPLGSETLEPSTLEELIDYLDTIPE